MHGPRNHYHIATAKYHARTEIHYHTATVLAPRTDRFPLSHSHCSSTTHGPRLLQSQYTSTTKGPRSITTKPLICTTQDSRSTTTQPLLSNTQQSGSSTSQPMIKYHARTAIYYDKATALVPRTAHDPLLQSECSSNTHGPVSITTQPLISTTHEPRSTTTQSLLKIKAGPRSTTTQPHF
jgi:hypothetical protein